MISLRTRALLIGCALLSLAGVAAAGGFSIYEAGAKATGMGCAVTASVDDGSAMFYNIAGISFMPGTFADANLMPVQPSIKFAGIGDPYPGYTAETQDQTFLIPGVGVTHNPEGRFAFGLGLAAPFGLGVAWEDPETYSGRFISYDVYLATVYITPAVSYRVTPQLAVAVGADIAHQHIELNRYAGQAFGGNAELVNALDVQLEGSSKLNITPAFGLMYKPTEKLSLGAMYHHEKTMEYDEGDGTLLNVAPAGPLRDAVEPLAGEYDLTTELGLPHMLSLGVAYQVHPQVLVEFDAVHFGWSNFDELALTFDPDPGGQLSSVIPEKYEDRWQYRFGVDVTLNEKWSLLAGYARDETPQPKASMSALLPDASRNDWSLGAQYRSGPWRFTASYMAVINESRDNLENGRVALFPEEVGDPETERIRALEAGAYESVANIFAFGIGHQF
jgi:long-chain fatty acid transport protein